MLGEFMMELKCCPCNALTLIHWEYTDKFVALFNQAQYVRLLFATEMGGAPKHRDQCITHLYKIFKIIH